MFFKKNQHKDNSQTELEANSEKTASPDIFVPAQETPPPDNSENLSKQDVSNQKESSPSEEDLLEMIRQNLNFDFHSVDTEGGLHEPSSAPLKADAKDDEAGNEKILMPEIAAILASVDPVGAGELKRLRTLLFGREIEIIELLRKHFANTESQAQNVSQVITEALLMRQGRDDKLKAVLKPTVTHIVNQSMRNHPGEMAEYLFPVIGPAIRRSIAETLKGMLQSLSKTLEMSFTLKGLKWRWEAFRSGKPFSEVVMMHTLLYQVEQIFFVHTETGLVLDHLVYEGVISQDASMVAGMLTAIQDFVKTSFAQDASDSDRLNTMAFGERTVYVEHLPSAYLACVVRGTPPISLTSDLRSALELMVRECADDLENFTGDTDDFKKARHFASDLLVASFAGEQKKIPFYIKFLPIAFIVALLGGFIYLKNEEWEMEKTIRHLSDATPGQMLIELTPSLLGDWYLGYMKDSLAPPMEEKLKAAGLPVERLKITYTPYMSMDNEIVRTRVATMITVPDTVKMYFDEKGILHISGKAPLGWIMSTREKALTISGVKGLDFRSLRDPNTEKLKDMVAKVDGVVIYFPLNKSVPVPEDMPKLAQAVDLIVSVEKLAKEMNLSVSLTIYGHADSTGSVTYNYNLSQERAKTLAAMLYAKGSSVPIFTYGLGSNFASQSTAELLNREAGFSTNDRKKHNQFQESTGEDQASRKIELRLHLSRLGSALLLDNEE